RPSAWAAAPTGWNFWTYKRTITGKVSKADMFKQIARGAALALCVLAAGCAQDLSPAPAPALPQQAVEAAPEPAAPVGSGRVETDLEEGSLTPEQTALLQRFMDGYYQALAHLQAPEG